MSKGIKETQELILFVSELAKAFKDAKSDGKIDLLDAIRNIGVLAPLATAIKDSGEIPLELADLNGEEQALLIVDFKRAIEQIIEAVAS